MQDATLELLSAELRRLAASARSNKSTYISPHLPPCLRPTRSEPKEGYRKEQTHVDPVQRDENWLRTGKIMHDAPLPTAPPPPNQAVCHGWEEFLFLKLSQPPPPPPPPHACLVHKVPIPTY